MFNVQPVCSLLLGDELMIITALMSNVPALAAQSGLLSPVIGSDAVFYKEKNHLEFEHLCLWHLESDDTNIIL